MCDVVLLLSFRRYFVNVITLFHVYRFHTSLDLDSNRYLPDTSRMKQSFNNNSSHDLYQNPHAVVVQHGKKVKTSLRQHEQQQEELFEL